MKQIDDNKTIDLLCSVKRPRGRPSTGNAMSGAERQKLRRERLRAAGEEVITLTVSLEVADALRRSVKFKDLTLGEAFNKIVYDRLIRKR